MIFFNGKKYFLSFKGCDFPPFLDWIVENTSLEKLQSPSPFKKYLGLKINVAHWLNDTIIYDIGAMVALMQICEVSSVALLIIITQIFAVAL